MLDLLNFLTLLNRGRKVYFNRHAIELVKKDKVNLLIIFDIISSRTKKEVENIIKDKKIEVRTLHVSKEELDNSFKKDVTLIGVSDIHAVKKILTLIDGK